ncbi:MAG: AAA family ATPase, partial [Actinomycetes bacterium]
IDTLARAFAGGNENASEDMGLLVLNMDKIREETGACVLFIHHSGKDAAKGARGHSSLRAALDTEIEVKADEETGAKVASVVKQRELAKGQVFGFNLETVVLGQNRYGEDVTTCLVRSANVQADTSGHQKSGRMSVDQQAAYSVLCDLIAERGQPNYRGVPNGAQSIPEQWWRERFYQRAKPGADEGTKQKAFRRAADALLAHRAVGMDHGRVWLP